MTSYINYKIGQVIEYMHILLVIYVLTGYYITPLIYLHYHLFLIILIFLDWKNNKECTLTKLEFYFKHNNISDETRHTREFIRPKINNLFNTNLTSKQVNNGLHILFRLCFILSFIRYIRYYHLL
jgi:hypothetical protein